MANKMDIKKVKQTSHLIWYNGRHPEGIWRYVLRGGGQFVHFTIERKLMEKTYDLVGVPDELKRGFQRG